jgi:hypothetical protein
MDDGWPRTLTACAGCRERDARIAELERQLADSQRRTTELERKLAEVTRESQRQTVKFPHRSVDHAAETRAEHGRASRRMRRVHVLSQALASARTSNGTSTSGGLPPRVTSGTLTSNTCDITATSGSCFCTPPTSPPRTTTPNVNSVRA